VVGSRLQSGVVVALQWEQVLTRGALSVLPRREDEAVDAALDNGDVRPEDMEDEGDGQGSRWRREAGDGKV
jgi:hypothetical protein